FLAVFDTPCHIREGQTASDEKHVDQHGHVTMIGVGRPTDLDSRFRYLPKLHRLLHGRGRDSSASMFNASASELRRVAVESARDMNTTGQAAPHRTPPNRHSAVYMIAFTVRFADSRLGKSRMSATPKSGSCNFFRAAASASNARSNDCGPRTRQSVICPARLCRSISAASSVSGIDGVIVSVAARAATRGHGTPRP